MVSVQKVVKIENVNLAKRRPKDNGPVDTYRIEVGRTDGVQVKNIVGAIANEADIPSKFIGDIRYMMITAQLSYHKICQKQH